ncbi:RibD family protein [Richelia sinica]|uniref:RibD family protein n=1 Tax=Richelia sinica TaxID=1357545 RepID=UPI001686C1C9|nr:RibD family protein [Richelia sinica]MBD2663449.1 RibD family protein [Richelia sinica FACHB-800]
MVQHRPHTTVVLAMSADGKIADYRRSPARFGSGADKAHLEKQIAASDAVIFGAGTLRAYGTTLTVTDPTLLQQRQQENRPPQPVHIVISHSANLNPEIKFFRQPVRRWLLTTSLGAHFWQERAEFEQILIFETPDGEIDTLSAWQYLAKVQISRVAVLGGGQLVATLLAANVIDEFWLTVCPVLLGGATAPTPVEGQGFLYYFAPQLHLLEVQQIEQEIFLHYQLLRPTTMDYPN